MLSKVTSMNQMNPHPVPNKADEINLIELAHKLMAQWPIIIVCTILALLGGLLSLHFATYTYTAELKVTPAQSSTQNSMSLQGLSGLASLAGVSLPGNLGGGTQFILYVEGATSRNTADVLAKQPELMKIVFKSEWDANANRFVENVDWFERWTNAIKKLIGIPVYRWTPPDGARLEIYLKDRVRIVEDRVKPIVTLSYNHEDPAFAVTFLSALNKTADDQLRQRTLSRVNDNIAYLSRQLATITLTEHRGAIIQALSEQEKTKMMASSGAPFAAEMISAPSASFRPTKPYPPLVIVVAGLVGVLFGIAIALARQWLGVGARKHGRVSSSRNRRIGPEPQSPNAVAPQ
jgi:LPS O-antigen subunit length determinant protein (WzzB/FepE family)